MAKSKNCNYNFIEIGFRGNLWISGCKKEIRYTSQQGVGVSEPPLPTDNGAKVCTFCGKPIKLTSRKPKQQPKIPAAPPPEKPTKKDEPPFQPTKPPPLFGSKPKVLEIDDNHNTYAGWQELGMQVMKGEKSCGRNADNLALFHRDSVTEGNKFK